MNLNLLIGKSLVRKEEFRPVTLAILVTKMQVGVSGSLITDSRPIWRIE